MSCAGVSTVRRTAAGGLRLAPWRYGLVMFLVWDRLGWRGRLALLLAFAVAAGIGVWFAAR